MPLWAIATLVAGAGAAAYAIWRYLQRKKQERQRQEAERRRQEAERREQERREVERALRSKAVQIITIMQADPLLAVQVQKMAGETHRPLLDMSQDSDEVQRIARNLPDEMLQTLGIAASQQDIEFDLEKSKERIETQYPTGDIEPVQMSDVQQITGLLPEHLIMDDDQFYAGVAQQNLLVLQPYETRVNQKLLYILIDVSGSMKDPMRSGVPRHVWSRGVTVNLLLRAVRGEAKYFLRTFDSQPHSLMRAVTTAEASGLIERILRTGLSGGGTNIWNAYTQAIKDIREEGGYFKNADILIVSDGQDNSMNQVEQVRQLLGDDIRLHVAMIGADSDPLKKVATTYKVYY